MRVLVGGASLALSIFLAGCGSGTSAAPPTPPAPPAAQLNILSPADGSTINGSPVTISVSAANISTASAVSVLLDGADITAQMSGPDAKGVMSAQVQPPAINYGKNQIQVRYQEMKVGSSFILDTGIGTPPPSSPANATNLLVPIKTRVLQNGDPTTATNWGIQVGSTTYYSNVPLNEGGQPCQGSPCNQGFQVLLLSRQDLSMVSNTSYEIDDANAYGVSLFETALESIIGSVPGCGSAGCIMVMQSLSKIGYAPCYGANLNICQDKSTGTGVAAEVFRDLGMSGSVLWANGFSSNVAYSFIGNAGSNNLLATGGSQYERLGCSDTRYQNPSNICDSLSAFNSSQNSPADPTQIGAISGVLVRDNYNSFTYSPNAPLITYTFGTTIVSGVYTNVLTIDGSATEGNGQYTMTLPAGSRGGFRMLVLDRNDPTGNGCLSCTTGAVQFDRFFDVDTGINDLIGFINNGGTGLGANSLIFFAGIGDLSHNDEDPTTVPTWNNFANNLADFGADVMTITLLGDIHPAFNPPTNPPNPAAMDDYLLVTRPIPGSLQGTQDTSVTDLLTMPPFQPKESGYEILRHTLSNAVSPTTVEGVLAQDNEGYYSARLEGLAQGLALPQTATIVSASLQAPTPWPFSSTTGQQNAYAYISSLLCCADIRSSYINLNASAEIWLTQLEQISYPTNQSSSFSQQDFNDVQSQLATEFAYVAEVRNLQNNVLALYQSQQSNVALILQQAEDDVQSDVFTDTPPPVQPSTWSAFTTDVFPVLSNLAGFLPEGGNAIKTALGVGPWSSIPPSTVPTMQVETHRCNRGWLQEISLRRTSPNMPSTNTPTASSRLETISIVFSAIGAASRQSVDQSPQASCNGTALPLDTSSVHSTSRRGGSFIRPSFRRIQSFL